jgi:hypothetical protein
MLAAVVVMGIVIVAVVAFTNRGGTPELKTTVVVKLQAMAALKDPTVVNIFLDGKPISKEQLAGDLTLVVGKHELKVEREDGTEETIPFEVGEGDNDQAVALPEKGKKKEKEARKVKEKKPAKDEGGKRERPADPPAEDEFPDRDSLPMKATWHIAALKKHFVVEKATYDAEHKKLSWHVRTKRNFGGSIGGELGLHTRLYDADDSRVWDTSLRFQPDVNVKKGEKVEVHFFGPAEEVLRKTKRILVFERVDKEFPAGLATPRKVMTGDPPDKIAWDLDPLRKHFDILGVNYDEGEKNVFWLLQAKRGFNSVGYEVRLHARYYDGDDARQNDAALHFLPDNNVLKGERIRLRLWVPPMEIRRQTKRILLLTPEEKEFKTHPGPALKVMTGDPPDKIAWDLDPLRKHFDILGVNYDEGEKHVFWLLQAKRGFGSVGYEVRLHARYYDGDDARQDDAALHFLPDNNVLKGERIRLRLWVPAVEVRRQTKRILLLTPEDKEFKTHPGPALKAMAGHPKDKFAWDLKPLEPYFDILNVNYDEGEKNVFWLLQAKRGFGSAGYELKLQARFYDGGGKRLDYSSLHFLPDANVLKGERIRLRVAIPALEVRAKVTKVVLEKP